MSTFTIPNNVGEIKQSNRGELFGELSETFNIDLSSNIGKIKSSQRLERILKEGVDIGTPSAIVDLLIWNSKYYLLTEDETYSCPVTSDPTDASNWSEDATVGDNELATTAVIFDGQMRISLNTDIARYNGSGSYATNWWTSDISGNALTSAKPHVLHVHRGGQETLFVTDDNKVRYYNATAGHSTVTLQSDLTACCVDSGISAIWVGTYNETNGNAYVYEMYVGEQINSTPVARNAYEVDGRAVIALWMKDNTPHIITERGNIQAFNGAGFTTIETFPFTFSMRPLEGVKAGQIQDANYSRPIHPRGVKAHNESTFIQIRTEADVDNYASDCRSHSGIWEYNHTTKSLNHRFALADDDEDYGVARFEHTGPLLVVDNEYTFLMTGANTELAGLYATVAGANQSWFVTPELTANTVQEAYEALYHKAKTLGASEDIYTLYRNTKRDTVYGTANWLTNDTFTTTDDWSNVSVGELVRVSHGYASGEWAVIKSIETSTNTYTIKLNRSIGSSAQTSYVFSDSFKLLGYETDINKYDSVNTYVADDGEFKKLGVNQVSPWIQYMVIMKGNIEYRQFISKGNSKTEI